MRVSALLILCVFTAISTAVPAEPTRTFLADLPSEVREKLPEGIETKSPTEQLQIAFDTSVPYRFDLGILQAFADARWFSTYTPGAPASAILELRRWPGDSRMLLYAIAKPMGEARDTPPPIPGAKLTLQSGSVDGLAEWSGILTTDSGDRPVVWIEQDLVADAPAYLGTLLLPGDAGLGETAVSDLTLEMREVFDRVLVNPDIWKRRPGLAPDAMITLGPTGNVPGAKDESIDPWQVAIGTDFTLGIPPGVQARRLDGDVPPPFKLPGGRLWLRGRYTDLTGTAVAIGDADRVGYVAEVEATSEWVSGKLAPVRLPNGKLQSGQEFALLKEKDRAAARSGRVERWSEPGFDGDWLVFRLEFEDRGVEIALPVLSGRESMSLFWIAASYRGSGRAPAEPPVDPAERFGIKWERLSRGDQTRQPWMEGYLSMPGLKVELPKSWWPSASLRSRAGYPIRLIKRGSSTMARIQRYEAAEVAGVVEAEGVVWEESERSGVHRAAKLYLRASDKAQLYVAREGHAFVFEIVDAENVGDEEWGRLCGSVQLVRDKH